MNFQNSVSIPFVEYKCQIGLFLGLLLIVAIILRVPLLFDDFWLDEIWNLNLARKANSFSDIFTILKVDANHILNTVVLYIAGDLNSWVAYRYVSFASGILTIFLIYRIGLYFDNNIAFTSALISAVNFLLVLYSTEARGYSLSIMFSLISFICLSVYLKSSLKRYVFLFWFSSVMAMLSHFSFIYIYAAYFQWTMYYFWCDNKRNFVRKVALLHLVPLSIFCFIYIYFISIMTVSGSNIRTWDHEILKFASLFFGVQYDVVVSSTLLLVCCAVVLRATYFLYQNNSIYWPLFLLTVIINPLLVIIFSGYGFPQMRYFLLLLPFLVLAFAIVFSELCQKIKAGNYVYWVSVCLFVVSSIAAIHFYAKQGRGEYLAALRYISEQEENTSITVSSNHDMRTIALIDFYRKYLPSNTIIKYRYQDTIQENPPEWYLLQDSSYTKKAVPNGMISVSGIAYNLSGSFYAANPDIMGWNWFVYRKESM